MSRLLVNFFFSYPYFFLNCIWQVKRSFTLDLSEWKITVFCLGSYLTVWFLLLYHAVHVISQFLKGFHKHYEVFLLPSPAHGNGCTRKCEDGKKKIPYLHILHRIEKWSHLPGFFFCLFFNASTMKLKWHKKHLVCSFFSLNVKRSDLVPGNLFWPMM